MSESGTTMLATAFGQWFAAAIAAATIATRIATLTQIMHPRFYKNAIGLADPILKTNVDRRAFKRLALVFYPGTRADDARKSGERSASPRYARPVLSSAHNGNLAGHRPHFRPAIFPSPRLINRLSCFAKHAFH